MNCVYNQTSVRGLSSGLSNEQNMTNNNLDRSRKGFIKSVRNSKAHTMSIKNVAALNGYAMIDDNKAGRKKNAK
jgi:hypothetical protein